MPPALVPALDLAPHPEGGWFRRTWTSPVTVATPGGTRPGATAILYLFDGPTRWHRLPSAELWVWQSGPPAELILGGSGDAPELPLSRLRLSLPADDGSPQVEVPAGVWQAARPLGAGPVLASCVVSPGFDFADFELRTSPEPDIRRG